MMASKCRKFVPNIFNKTKCQTCFGSKEQHSAEALENNKASRKVSKCGYLFVAPGYDFSNPLDKTKRWQRRFFVLYDDGELAYSVDENPDTVPQGVIDMNKCTDVKDATGSTSHSNSLAIITPEKTTYIKGNSKEEIQWWQNILGKFPEENVVTVMAKPNYLIDRNNKENIDTSNIITYDVLFSFYLFKPFVKMKRWHDVLIVYPRSICKPKQRRFTVPSYSFLNKENLQPKSQPSQETNGESKGRFEVEKVKTKDQGLTYRGVRNMKHTKGNKNYQEGLRKSSSLHDLTTEEKESGSLDNSRFLSRSGDRLDDTGDHARLLAGYENNPYATLPRSGWKSPVSLQESSSNSSLSTSASASSIPDNSSGHKRRGSFDDKALQTLKSKNASERARLHRERSASMKSFPTGLTLPKIQSTVGSSSADRLVPRAGSSESRQPVNQNETDELKMAKSTEMQSASRSTPPPPSPKAIGGASTKFESPSDTINHIKLTLESPDREQDLMYMKKGWLIKMGTSEKDWKKHWFVLTGNSLRYYKDAKAEESNSLDGRIDLSTCYEISEVQIQRNYGFKIKTRNGEYTLSAMTSGIRSNWMKAIRLCMDLQNSNKNAGKSTVDVSQRTNDDMDIDTSSSSSGISVDKSRGPEKKKEPIRNIRRHYSDVNPGNIGKMFSIKGLTLDNSNNQSQSGSSGSSMSSAASSKEPSIERETHSEQMAQAQTSPDTSWKPGKYDQVWSGDTSNGIPFRRFVEGSDDHVTVPLVSNDPPSKSSDKSDDEDRKKRAKSPSAKIKERSRAKSPKLHSPPPGHEPESTFSYTTTEREEDKMSVSSEEIDFADGVDDDNIHLDTDHNLATSAAGEGMLVDLLENEVESLKERLEHTQQELAKSHDSNRDLKTKLQSVVREKDNSGQLQSSIDSSYPVSLAMPSPEIQQMNALKRQLKDAKDSVQRQKSEIDQLKSKLDMSTSKLTGTEKALSEALKDVKQEKDKFLKVSQEYNKKVRSMENQLKEVTSKMEKYHENSLIKDKENRKLDLELKQHLQKMRDHEREIIKLKAVEHEFRQMKEKLDENEKVMSRLRKDLKDKNDEFKKMEMEYEVQFENMMQEFTKERDDTEHHIEELKSQLLETSRKSGMSDQVSKDVANLLRDKDEIIAQLEEKVIENESKMVEMSEEIKTDVEENTELHQNIELLHEERDNAVSKIKELEKALSQSKSQVQRMDKENQSIRKHMDDLRKENTDLSDRLNTEKTDRSTLKVDNDGLKSTVKELEQEVHSLHDKLNEVCSSHDRLSVSSDSVKSQELLHTFVLATADMNDVSDSVLKMRKQFETILATYKGEKALELIKIAEMVEDICKKCDNVSEVLKEGASIDDNDESKQSLSQSRGRDDLDKEMENIKKKNSQVTQEAEQYKAQLTEAQNKYKKLKEEDQKVKDQLESVNKKLESKVEDMNKRIHNIALKAKADLGKKAAKKKRDIADPKVLSEVIDEQLGEIEDRVALVERAIASQDLRHAVGGADNQTETEESEAETEDSEDYLLSEDESEESDSDSNEEGTVADENESLIGKLQELKNLFSITNGRVKDLTRGIPEEDHSEFGMESVVEKELRETLSKCGEKIDSLTSRLSDGLELARTDIPRFSDQTWAFRKCVNKLKSKVEEVSILAHEHDELNAKDVKTLQGKLQHLVEYVVQIDRLGENDWDIAGKIAKQEMKFQHLLLNKEKAARKSTLKYEDRLQLYADKMAFEAMVLGQMGILIQRQQVGTMYKDALLREIHEANLQILELERRIDNANREMNPSEQEKDMVSSYAAILAERIVLEGQLASCAMVQNVESSENMEILTALNVDETPTVLAMEIFIRSQVDSSISDQLKKTAENMEGISNHIVTRALLQGEITHALKVVKQKFKVSDSKEDLSSCVKRERQFAFEELENRHKMILDLVNETEPVIMTTLIQLIEFSQGPNSPTLNTVCDHIQSVVNKTIEEYEHLMESADTNTKSKVQYIIAHLHSELEDALAIFQEEYNCYVQTASPDIDPNVLKFSADSLASELAGLFIQKAVIDGSYAFICEFYKKNPEIPVGQMVDRLDTDGNDLTELAIALGQILLSEAANKQKVAAEVRNATSEDADEMSRNLTNLIGVIPDLEAYPQSFNAYTATLVREAMFQSQLTYTTYKLKMHYHRDLRDIKLKLEAGEAVLLPSEISKEAESDIQASLATFEDILNTKYQDECAVLSLLESEIDKLKNVITDKGSGKYKAIESNLKQLQKTFEHEVSVAQERQNVHSDVLRQKVNNVILRVDKFLEDNEKEKERMKADYEDRIATLQDEFDLMRVNHEEELEQVRQDIMTAVSAIKASEEEAETNSVEQLKNHNKQLMKMSVMCKELLTELKANPGVTGKNEDLAEKIESQLGLIQQIESDPNFTLDTSLPLTFPESPGLPTKTLEPPQLDRTLSAEKSDENVDKLLERSQHEHEMELLKREKEAALAEEIKTTRAALDAMQKAYTEDLEQEKEKYRYALKTMFTDDYVEEIRRRHESEHEKLSEELKQISMHYESKCEDYKLMEDRLQRTKQDYQTHINHLVKSNEQLTELVNTEIENLKTFIQTRTKGQLTGSATLEEELYDSQIMVRVKDAELQKLRQQVKNLENSLERMTEEQRYTMTQYLQCLKKNQEMQAKMKQEIIQPKERRDSAQEDQLSKSARALRRNPSFHQRARSPSPDTSPRKDNSTEHHSRDSHRRSRGHLSAKDLKRSKSSPSLPFVFEAKSPAMGSLTSPNGSSGLARRESGKKYGKNSKK